MRKQKTKRIYRKDKSLSYKLIPAPFRSLSVSRRVEG